MSNRIRVSAIETPQTYVPPVIKMPAQVDNFANNFVGAGTLSWEDMFGNYNPKHMRGESGQLRLSAVFCAINMYCGSITSLPRFTQRIESATQRPVRYVSTTEHPASRIWSHYANDELTSNNLLKMMTFDILFSDGNFYAIPEYDSQNRVSRCHYVHPSRVPRGAIRRANMGERLSNGRMAKRGSLVYHVMSGVDAEHEASLRLSQDEIIHMKGSIPDPDYHRSQGILENNMRSAGLYDAAEEMGSKFYKRGITNQMFLATEGRLSGPVRKEMEDLVNNMPNSIEGAPLEELFKTRILEHGLKPVHVGMPLNAIQFIETRAFSVEDVGRWFSIPPAILHSVMGTGQNSPDYDKLMVMWIQNGLGYFMTNLASEFRDNFIPQAFRPLYKFDFNRLHLYKTILSDFSTALRNLFEIGAIDRWQMSDLLGTYLNPNDPTNAQRYVPANLVTVEHSLSMQDKAAKSVDVMDQQLSDMEQKSTIDKENHDRAIVQQDEAIEAAEANPDLEDEQNQEQSEQNQDNRTNGNPPDGTVPKALKVDNIVKTALYNTMKGLHDYECRVAAQKLESRPDDFHDAMNEWRPKYVEKVKETVKLWSPIIQQIKDEDGWKPDVTFNYADILVCDPEQYTAELALGFDSSYGFLIGDKDGSSSSES